MRRIKVTLAALGAVGAMGALAPGAVAAPGQECGDQTQSKANWAHEEHANMGNSKDHMGMGHGPGGMMKAEPFCDMGGMHGGHM